MRSGLISDIPSRVRLLDCYSILAVVVSEGHARLSPSEISHPRGLNAAPGSYHDYPLPEEPSYLSLTVTARAGRPSKRRALGQEGFKTNNTRMAVLGSLRNGVLTLAVVGDDSRISMEQSSSAEKAPMKMCGKGEDKCIC